MLSFNEYAKLFISLFAVLDPVGIIPIIIAFTMDLSPQKRVWVGRIASVSVCGILLTSLLLGKLLLEFFGISLYSFRTAGGLILLMMSVKMLVSTGHNVSTDPDDDSGSSIAVVPLSTPLLAGPGAISTVILDAQKGHGVLHYTMMVLVIVLLSISIWLTFLAAPWVQRRMGKTGINVFSRLMGMILAAIAVEFIAGGMRGLFPGLN